MKVKIIKNLKKYKEWNKYVGKIYEAQKNKSGSYKVKLNGFAYMTTWEKDEVKEIK